MSSRPESEDEKEGRRREEKRRRNCSLCTYLLKKFSYRHTPITLALRRLRQEDFCKFQARLGYIMSSKLAWAR